MAMRCLDARQDMDACREMPEQACSSRGQSETRPLAFSGFVALPATCQTKQNEAQMRKLLKPKNKTWKPEPIAALRLSRTFVPTVRMAFGLQLNSCLEQRNSSL